MDDYIDPSEILGDILSDWRDYWHGESPYERTLSLLRHMVALPYPDECLPLVVSYLWANPKFSSVLPVLFCYGQPGSAKSNLAIIASKLRESDPLNADNCTAVSLRNTCNSQKFLDAEAAFEADGALLILDNVQTATFRENRNLLSLFLGGYKRGQDKVQIGGKDGANIEFYTFSSRIISSVEPLHLEYDLRELASRCWVVPHQQLDKIPDETLSRQGFSIEDSIKPEDVNWQNFSSEYLKFWGSKANCKLFAACKKSLRNTEKFAPRAWEMSRDVLATGMAIGAFEDAKKAKLALARYQMLMDSFEAQSTPLEEILKDDFLSKVNGVAELDNALLVHFIDGQTNKKNFLERPKPKAIEDAMKRLGWHKRKGQWIKAN